MNFDTATWWLVALLFGLAISIVGYFLKRTISKTDDHEKDINDIKRTYVTKDELQSVKTELRDEVSDLAKDVKEIKENALTKADFYRTQTATDRKIDKIYDMILNMTTRGGKSDGQ